MGESAIRRVRGRQILDSRGRPTVEVDVELAGGAIGRAAVPSGASRGSSEAHELRDGDPAHYGGRGVLRAVGHIDSEIAATLQGMDACDQRAIDERMLSLDGTHELSRLGANAVLGVSMAACRAAALALSEPLHRYIARLSGSTPALPLPMVNILSGGLHAGGGMDLQDFLVVPIGARSATHAIELASLVRTAAHELCAERRLPTLLADEGGLSPAFASSTAALDLMMAAFGRAGLVPGRDVAIAIDFAATELQSATGTYRFGREGCTRTSGEVIGMVIDWLRAYPLVSIEDPLAEEDWTAWGALTKAAGDRVQIVGDDLFTTHAGRLLRGIEEGVANAVLIKLNQNGTVTGTLDTMALARKHGYATIVSARSGETEDAFMADFAVGTAAGQIKVGSLRCSERLAKYNQLLRIEQEGDVAFAAPASGPHRPDTWPT